jgi:hypothetical protein
VRACCYSCVASTTPTGQVWALGARPDARGAGSRAASRKEAHLGVPAAPSMGAAFDRLDRSVKDPKTIGAEPPSRGATVRQAGKPLR